MKFEGIFPPVITPHFQNGDIDYGAFEQMVDYLAGSGVHGVIVSGTTGEYYAQSDEERSQLVKLAQQTLAGRIPLIVGVGAIRTEDCIKYGRYAAECNADAILMPAPFYAVPSQRELANHALAIDRAVNLPIMLYNYPGRTGTMMEAEFFNIVGRNRNFQAIKESSGDINQLHMLGRQYRNINLLCGMDDQALEFFAWGAKGWVCAGGNCLAREHIALYEACVIEKNFDKGRAIMTALMPFMHILEQGGKFIQSIKYACSLAGLPSGPVRQPLQELSKESRREIQVVLETLTATIDQILSSSNPTADKLVSNPTEAT